MCVCMCVYVCVCACVCVCWDFFWKSAKIGPYLVLFLKSGPSFQNFVQKKKLTSKNIILLISLAVVEPYVCNKVSVICIFGTSFEKKWSLFGPF